jgi:hypothetical protein
VGIALRRCADAPYMHRLQYRLPSQSLSIKNRAVCTAVFCPTLMPKIALVILTGMHSEMSLWVEAGLLPFTFLVIVPSIAGVIGYAA